MFKPILAQRLKQFRRRFGIMAPQVIVRPYFNWRWHVGLVALFFVLLMLINWFFSQRDDAGFIDQELGRLRLQVLAQQEELLRLRSTVGTEQNAAHMERSAKKTLVAQIQGLERENALLKEDIRLFERLVPAGGEEAQIRIENFRLALEPGGLYRYRLLLAFRPGKQLPEFKGHLQLVATLLLDGRERTLIFPERQEKSPDFSIELKHFLRREGVLNLPAGARVKSLEARVLQGDALKIKQFAQL